MRLELGEEHVAFPRGGRPGLFPGLLVDDRRQPLELVPHRSHHRLEPVPLNLRSLRSLLERRDGLGAPEPARLRARGRVAQVLLGLAELLTKPRHLHGHGAVDAGGFPLGALADEKRLAESLDLVRQLALPGHPAVDLGARGVELVLHVRDGVDAAFRLLLRVFSSAFRLGEPRLGLVESLA